MLSDYKDILSISASVTTILQFCSGSLVCNKYFKNGDTGDDSSLPFVLGIFSCSLWLCYGLIIYNTTIIAVNVTGCALFLSYAIIFYVYTTRKVKVKQQFCIIMVLLFIIQLYIRKEHNTNLLKNSIGSIACFITVCFLASPLSNFFHVIRIKNTESLPKPFIIMSTAVSFQWLLYGIILDDVFIQYPNALGLALCIFQLLLCLFYSRRSPVIVPYSKSVTL